MSRLLPKTMFGQTLILLLVGIGLSLSAGAWIYSSAGQEAVRAVGAMSAAERIINLVKLVDEMPPALRDRLVRGSSEATFKVSIEAQKPLQDARDTSTRDAPAILDFIKTALGGREVTIAVTSSILPSSSPMRPPDPPFGSGLHGPIMPRMRMHDTWRSGPMMREGMSWRGLEAAVALGDGHWLKISTTLPDTGPVLSRQAIIALAVVSGLIALLTGWVVRRMTTPLSTLSSAADALGRNVDAPPLSGAGTIEVRRAAQAFNDMQSRLKRLIENRTLMLAALSHDLRTQLTLLRLRAETIEASENRDRMLTTISDMEGMLTTTLTFARDEAASEIQKRVDVSALLMSVVDDMADAGLPVAIDRVSHGLVLDCKPVALRRAVTNLVDNAVKYGARARVSAAQSNGNVEIVVDDEGPGIPDSQIRHVTQPFYRIENSRNRETGGTGLGLTIASAIAEAHGGKLILENLPECGLRSRIKLPLRSS